MQSQKNRLDF